jgi:hypothetical protein
MERMTGTVRVYYECEGGIVSTTASRTYADNYGTMVCADVNECPCCGKKHELDITIGEPDSPDLEHGTRD